jgi:hypothetical protein
MGYAVKYSTSNVNNTFRKGNVVLGVSSEGYEDTDTSGLYAGLPPVAGKHNIVITSASGDPDFYSVDDDGLILLSRNLGQEVDNVNDALLFLSQQDNLAFTDQLPNDIITDGLILDLNASNLLSYPTTGSTWYDLSGNNNSGSLVNGISYSNGVIKFDGTNDKINLNSLITLSGPFTWMVTCYSNNMSGTSNRQVYVGQSTTWFEQSDDDTLFIVNNNERSFNLELPTDITPQDKYYNVAIKRKSNNTFDYYFNGVKQTLRSGGNIQVSGSYYINTIGSLGNARFWDGGISKVQVYNKELTDSEISQNYYGGPIVTDGLVLAVDAGNLVSYESGSTTAYNMTGSINGTLTNGVKYNSNNGGHWEFDGVDDYITWGDNFDLVSSNISGFVWGKVNTLDDYTPWIDKLSGGGNYRFHSDRVGRLVLGIRDSNNTYQQTVSTSVLSIDTWYNIGFTFNNSTREGKIYLNGNLIHSNTFTIDRGDTTTGLQTGYQANNGGTLNGAVATLSLYDKVLTADEVLQNYNAQKNRFI